MIRKRTKKRKKTKEQLAKREEMKEFRKWLQQYFYSLTSRQRAELANMLPERFKKKVIADDTENSQINS